MVMGSAMGFIIEVGTLSRLKFGVEEGTILDYNQVNILKIDYED